jgi:uncharacterized phage protein (TIGR02218 family)
MTLQAHLATGATTIARAWAITRRDGVVLGFTDHDRALSFDGITFAADAGLSAQALEQLTGLAVDNSEAVGALSDAGLTEGDIIAGRYDSADLRIWQVNWADVTQRALLFRGTLGEITRAGGAFRVELRGLSEALNQSGGRVFHAACSAVLGDSACGFDLSTPSYTLDLPLGAADGARLTFAAQDVAQGWFTHGRACVLTGAATGQTAMIRDARTLPATLTTPEQFQLDLWAAIRAPLVAGDLIRLEAGCDKSATTCCTKFNNFINFRGFPHIPGEDWLAAYPKAGQPNTGGRRG